MMKKNAYLLVISLNLILNSEIIIEFNSTLSEIPNNLSPIDFITSLISNELYVNLNIGSPPQNLDFLIDFDSYHTYILKDNIILHNNKKLFQNTSSSTFTKVGKNQFFQNLDFQVAISCTDFITINENIKNINYTFLLVQDKKLRKNISYPGVIGMGVVSNGEPFYDEVGLIYQLKKANISNNYLYTIVFDDNSFNGKIIIEKNIHEDCPIDDFIKDYCLVTYEYEYYWGWDRLKSYYGSKELEIKKIYLKPELGVIEVNLKIKDMLKRIFFDEKIKEGKCYEDSKDFYSFFYCDKDVTITLEQFYFQLLSCISQLFFLDSNDLTIEYNDKKYFLMIFVANFPNDQIYLGYPFFKKFDLIFNQDKGNVGFYNLKKDDKSNNNQNNNDNKNKNGDNGNNLKEKNSDTTIEDISDNDVKRKNYDFKILLIKILLFVFVVLCILFLAYLIFYFYRKNKRKSNEKLYEKFYNTSVSDNGK